METGPCVCVCLFLFYVYYCTRVPHLTACGYNINSSGLGHFGASQRSEGFALFQCYMVKAVRVSVCFKNLGPEHICFQTGL